MKIKIQQDVPLAMIVNVSEIDVGYKVSFYFYSKNANYCARLFSYGREGNNFNILFAIYHVNDQTKAVATAQLTADEPNEQQVLDMNKFYYFPDHYAATKEFIFISNGFINDIKPILRVKTTEKQTTYESQTST